MVLNILNHYHKHKELQDFIGNIINILKEQQ